MEARDRIRYRLLNYLIEAHECQLISANVAILSEIAEADWSEVKDVLNELFLYGDIVLTKDTQPILMEKEPPAGQAGGLSPSGGANSEQA